MRIYHAQLRKLLVGLEFCVIILFFFNQIYLVYKLHKIPSKQGILLKQAGHKNFTVRVLLLKMN